VINLVVNKRIVKKVKAKYWRTTHKVGIRLPKNVEKALRIDAENNNTLWRDAIEKEMSKAKISYSAVEDQHRKMYDQINATLCGDIRKSSATLYLT
jgi:hypothetical protein